MNIEFLFRGQRFIWDPEKAFNNSIKHGVRFERACEVFFDPLVRSQDASTEEEQRHAVIGISDDWTLLFVVHLEREGDATRIISARLATAQERRRYEDDE